MNRSEYKQMLTLKYFYEEKLQEIKKKHKSDPDLFHPIGKDRYCLYCEKYQEIQDKLQPMVKQLMEYEKTHEVKQPVIQQLAAVPKKEKAKSKKVYQVYSLLFKDGSEYLVYTFAQETGCRLLGRQISELSKAVPISKDYYSSIYLEQEDGSIISVEARLQEHSTKKSWLVAEKQQTRIKAKGNCFNEKPFEYLKYTEGQYGCLRTFCGNTAIKKTKKFSKNGKVAFETARGMIALEYGQVLLKLFPGTFMVISEQEFNEYFVEDESLVWMKKE
ncbi:hypothetical protein [Enterococcus mundtii]|uniref:hypothetical protein n=1 Tax=Enterococcus mundtii TaxID=53346 RepID=UPI002DBEE134|nr:hypothetical protein [Enterococcus mundtii]MEC3942707.1 hypothetical protein [Enterococcus mundtii]